MSQQLIDVGTVANDRTGDTWRDAFIKVNANETELFDLVGADTAVFIAEEADFPTQDATTITLESQTVYVITAAFSTAKNFICVTGASITARNIDGPRVTFTGTGAMFSGTDSGLFIHDITIDPGASAEAFNFEDTIGGLQRFLARSMSVVSCAKVATFDDMFLSEFEDCNALAATQGVEYKGTSNQAIVVNRLALFSSSATFKGLDLGTSSALVIEINDLIVLAGAGAFGISGLANNGNVPTGSLAMVSNSEFLGALTPLENITIDDTRWSFSNNVPIPDTFADALISFRNNATETVISTINTPVIVNATWVLNRASLFTTTTGGRATYEAERDITAPIDISAGLISSGGGAIDVTLYVAINGSVITASGVLISISGSSAQTLSIPWQETLSEDDFVEVFVENNSNTTNIIVEYATLRVR